MLVARKSQSRNKQHAVLEYIVNEARDVVISLHEDTEMCDGIGGIVWEGAMVLAQFLTRFLGGRAADPANTAVIELGAGTGLAGLVAALSGAATVITDRNADLAAQNTRTAESLLSRSGAAPVDVRDFHWGEDVSPLLAVHGREHTVVCGAEIACLYKQHPLLLDSLRRLAALSPSTLVLITFDGLPQDAAPRYKRDFVEEMTRAGFAHAVVCAGSVQWIDDENNENNNNDSKRTQDSNSNNNNSNSNDNIAGTTSREEGAVNFLGEDALHTRGVYRDLTHCVANDLHWLALHDEREGENKAVDYSPSAEESCHHVIAFFHMSTMRKCENCGKHFFPGVNSTGCPLSSCRHHT